MPLPNSHATHLHMKWASGGDVEARLVLWAYLKLKDEMLKSGLSIIVWHRLSVIMVFNGIYLDNSY